MTHDDPSADRHPLVEVDDLVVRQTEAARRHGMADRLRLVGAMDAVDRVAEIHRAGAERVARTTCHPTRQVGLARNHFRRRCPVGPFRLARDCLEPGPLESLAADADAVAQCPVVALDDVEEALRRIDHNGAGRLGGAEEHHLPLVDGVELLLLGGRLVAGRLLDRQLGLRWVDRLTQPRLRGGCAAQSDRHDDRKPILHDYLLRHEPVRPSARRRPGCASTASVPALTSRSTWSGGSLKRVSTLASMAARTGSSWSNAISTTSKLSALQRQS